MCSFSWLVMLGCLSLLGLEVSGNYGPPPPESAVSLASSNTTLHYDYVGCFRDAGDSRGLRGRDLNETWYESPDENSYRLCAAFCSSMGYQYFGVQWTIQCFCGDEFGIYSNKRPEIFCNYRCPNNYELRCGGFWHNMIFKIIDEDIQPEFGSVVLSESPTELKFEHRHVNPIVIFGPIGESEGTGIVYANNVTDEGCIVDVIGQGGDVKDGIADYIVVSRCIYDDGAAVAGSIPLPTLLNHTRTHLLADFGNPPSVVYSIQRRGPALPEGFISPKISGIERSSFTVKWPGRNQYGLEGETEVGFLAVSQGVGKVWGRLFAAGTTTVPVDRPSRIFYSGITIETAPFVLSNLASSLHEDVTTIRMIEKKKTWTTIEADSSPGFLPLNKFENATFIAFQDIIDEQGDDL